VVIWVMHPITGECSAGTGSRCWYPQHERAVTGLGAAPRP
jgi:hypothetical protein